jgi:hypothetical protein
MISVRKRIGIVQPEFVRVSEPESQGFFGRKRSRTARTGVLESLRISSLTFSRHFHLQLLSYPGSVVIELFCCAAVTVDSIGPI